MFSRNLETIAGISIYPLISLIIFFGFFTVLLMYLLKADKKMLERVSRIPLQSSETPENTENA